MTMNPFEQNEHLLHFMTSQVEREVIDYIRQEMQHGAPESIPAAYRSPAFAGRRPVWSARPVIGGK